MSAVILVRQLLLYVHLIVFAFALVTVLRADVMLLKTASMDLDWVASTKRTLTRLLVALWVTGVALVVSEAGVSLADVLTRPKLAAKLTVVSILVANGLLLHCIAFPKLVHGTHRPWQTATLCTFLGVISTVSWLYASFVGVARMIEPALDYVTFMGLYLCVLVAGLMIALPVIRPRLERLLLPAATVGAVAGHGCRVVDAGRLV
jgi:hypothetical protein